MLSPLLVNVVIVVASLGKAFFAISVGKNSFVLDAVVADTFIHIGPLQVI
jgi:hypothetical protein